MLPSVQINELDGALGVLPSGSSYFAIVGVSDSGPIATPAAFSRTQDVISNYGAGPLVEAACYFIAAYDQPVLLVRATASVAATESVIVTTGVTGSSAVTVGADTTANDDYEVVLRVVAGGTVGTTGITYQTSLDGGRSWSAVTALGVATSITIAGSGGIGFALGTGTLVAGDTASFRTIAPNWAAGDLTPALTALKLGTIPWDVVSIVGPIDATSFAAIGTSFAGMPEKAWIGHTRIPTIGESESAYKTALDGIFSSLSTTFGMLTAASAKVSSAVSGRLYKRPISFAVAPLAATVSHEVDIAAIDVGNLPGVIIKDANGNPDEHDELVTPGLDDSRFTVLRTWDGEQGIYVCNSRLFSSSGSDFQWFQHRRIMNLLKRTTRIYFQRRLSKPIKVDTTTGFILESEAVAMEAACNAAIRGAIMAKPMASGGAFGPNAFVKINRTTNLLSGNDLLVQEGLVPLFYPKKIIVNTGFSNPSVQAV